MMMTLLCKLPGYWLQMTFSALVLSNIKLEPDFTCLMVYTSGVQAILLSIVEHVCIVCKPHCPGSIILIAGNTNMSPDTYQHMYAYVKGFYRELSHSEEVLCLSIVTDLMTNRGRRKSSSIQAQLRFYKQYKGMMTTSELTKAMVF